MITARPSGGSEAETGRSLCGDAGPSAEDGPALGASWLSMTSALYTMEDQYQKGHFVFMSAPSVSLAEIMSTSLEETVSVFFLFEMVLISYERPQNVQLYVASEPITHI